MLVKMSLLTQRHWSVLLRGELVFGRQFVFVRTLVSSRAITSCKSSTELLWSIPLVVNLLSRCFPQQFLSCPTSRTR